MMKPTGFDMRRAHASRLLATLIKEARRPVIMSSFGKDSLVLLTLAEDIGAEVEIAYFELGAVQSRHQFARRTIATHSLHVTLLRPHKTLLAAGHAGADLAYQFDLASGDSVHIVGATFNDSSSSELLCGLDVPLVKEGRHEPYEWQTIFTGRRRVDVDKTLGSMDLRTDCVRLSHGSRLVMPILEWTDEDVLYFLTQCGKFAPDWDRYEIVGGRLQSRECSNPDHMPICIRCLSTAAAERPACPLSLDQASARYALRDRKFFTPGAVPPTVMV